MFDFTFRKVKSEVEDSKLILVCLKEFIRIDFVTLIDYNFKL